MFGMCKDINLSVNVTTPDNGLGLLIIQKLENMNEQLQKLAEEVTELKSVQQSAIVLLQGLSDRIKEADGDKAKLAELTAELDASTNTLATAVAANTPATEGNGEEL